MDKNASEVRREGYAEPPLPPKPGLRVYPRKNQNERRVIGERELILSNLEKPYWPDDNITKRDLVEYYESIAEYILPHLKDRPESLHRFPNGINGDKFYEKNAGSDIPEWIPRFPFKSETEHRTVNYLLCQEIAALVYLANLGCIEINPWNSRAQSPELPDYMVFDLDPDEINFKEVVNAALATRSVLKEIGIDDVFIKTSGATGLHIFVPLGAQYTYDQTREFAEIINREVHRRLPKTTSIERKPENRHGKVYLDHLQNRLGQTMASAYSVRPRPGAPVSTPLAWDEVNERLDPKNFTMKNTKARLDKVGDLWKDLHGLSIDLAGAIKKFEK